MSLRIWDIRTSPDDGDHREGGLGRIAVGNNEVGVGLDTVTAAVAAEDGLGDGSISCVGGTRVELLAQTTLAPRTRELPVELVLLSEFRSEYILESLNRTTCEFGVHLFEDAHEARVAECPQH